MELLFLQSTILYSIRKDAVYRTRRTMQNYSNFWTRPKVITQNTTYKAQVNSTNEEIYTICKKIFLKADKFKL